MGQQNERQTTTARHTRVRVKINYPALLADADAKRARAEHVRQEAVGALLMILERQIIGSILCHGRNALRVVLRYTRDLFSWAGNRFYDTCIFVAAITGPQPPGLYDNVWSGAELRAMAELSGIGRASLLTYFPFAISRPALLVVVRDFCMWMMHQ